MTATEEIPSLTVLKKKKKKKKEIG